MAWAAVVPLCGCERLGHIDRRAAVLRRAVRPLVAPGGRRRRRRFVEMWPSFVGVLGCVLLSQAWLHQVCVSGGVGRRILRCSWRDHTRNRRTIPGKSMASHLSISRPSLRSSSLSSRDRLSLYRLSSRRSRCRSSRRYRDLSRSVSSPKRSSALWRRRRPEVSRRRKVSSPREAGSGEGERSRWRRLDERWRWRRLWRRPSLSLLLSPPSPSLPLSRSPPLRSSS